MEWRVKDTYLALLSRLSKEYRHEKSSQAAMCEGW